MEIVEGKLTDKKVVIAQEIAIAKVLCGNNKVLRDRALKKLKKWLFVRGNGKLAFTEEDFIRIWTGLFYCMWMSDKFLVQEELAESISNLIHCFKKNSDCALLFVKCFNKRILMEWEGLDQYRIDKFNMLVRRFLRQTFQYCKEKDWDISILRKLMHIFYNVVLHRDNALGFVLHFINIYPEELAKVSMGKLPGKTLLALIEPFVKLISTTRDDRIRKEAEDLFYYLMRQTDIGIDYQEQFEEWRMRGYPGKGPQCLRKVEIPSWDDDSDFTDDEDGDQDGPLDPRAGSVHVVLPQIPINPDNMIKVFKQYKNSKSTCVKGRKMLKNLIQKYSVLKKGKFPETVKKDLILEKNLKKRNQVEKNAKNLLKFTESLNSGPIQTQDFKELDEEIQKESDDESSSNEEENLDELVDNEEEVEVKKPKVKKLKKKVIKKNGKKKNKIKIKEEKMKAEGMFEENQETKVVVSEKKKKKKKAKEKNKTEENIPNGSVVKTTPTDKNGLKRKKVLSNWQVQELDSNSPEYYKIDTPKVIRIEKKVEDFGSEENKEPENNLKKETTETTTEENLKEAAVPAFWEKAKSKVTKKSKMFLNPFAEINGESKASGDRRISFALERNMAQENEEYLEEVKNSPKVPFDGTKKPVQSALKSGLAPSPVNPFYRFKRIKF